MIPTDDLPPPPGGAPFAMLDGIRVLDLTTSIAGPYATLALADYGAEVIKIERIGHGDDSRLWGPPFLDGESLWFLSVNRNKRSIALDYTGEEGCALLAELISASDVLVTNQVSRVQEKLGTDAATVRSIRPDIIHASLTGFGTSGRRKDWVAYDLIAEGYSGVMDLTGEADREPQKVGTPAGDLLTGMDLTTAIIAALFERQRTGKGRTLDISMIESMTRFMSSRLISYLGSGELARRAGGRESVIAVYQTFDTADEPITLGLGNDAIWARFWIAAGLPDKAEDESRATNPLRRQQRAEIVGEIQGVLSQRSRAEWLDIFAEHRVPAGPINRLDQVAEDETLLERGFLYAMARDGKPDAPQVGTGILVDGEANSPRSAPPDLSADTDDVLQTILGKSADDIASLRDRGVLG